MSEARRRPRRATTRIVAALALTVALVGGLAEERVWEESDTARAAASRPDAHGALAAALPEAPSVSVLRPRPRSRWAVAARVAGLPGAWVARHGGVTLLRFDQRHVRVVLHAGSADGGIAGWTYGDRVGAEDLPSLLAAVNGGFKLTYTNVGFMSGGHVAVPLKAGLASIVTYTDGSTNIGAWRAGVPSSEKVVFSVLQNQSLLVDHGTPAASASTCIIGCWGGTIGLASSVARSGLGITPSGMLVWAAGEHLTPLQLAEALIRAGAIRAIELDINPWWVAGYVYLHHSQAPRPVPLVTGQRGVAGGFLKPYSRDFLAFLAK